MTQTFSQCTNLKSIPLLDLSSLYGFSNLFSGTNELVDLEGFKDLGKGFIYTSISTTNTLDLSYNNQLTHESLMNVIYNLYDLNLNGKVGGLKLGTTNLNKLTSDEISIATNKGWTVS